MEKDLIVLTLDNGEEKEFMKLAEFSSKNTNKDYIILTDKEFDGEKNNIYFNIVKEDNGKVIFDKIESDEDMEECKKAFDELLKMVSKKE